MSEMIVKCYRGYTHAVINLLQSSSVAGSVGNYIRDKLVEREWQPEHMERDRNGHWFRVRARLVQKYMYVHYDQKAQKLFIPIAFYPDVVNVLKDAGAQVEEAQLQDYEPRKIEVAMRPQFHDMEHQIELIQKCSETTPGMKGLAMQTGKGKTYSAIKSWVNLGYTGLVIVKGLMDQWIQSIRDFTDIDKEDIYKIQEFNSLALLAQHPEYKPKIFVASLKTLQLFSEGSNDYDLLPWDYRKFLATYGVGVKIVDECHQCFHATVMMDLKSNVKYNLYCSATFTQSSKQAKDIFLRVFPKEIQYGISNYDRYVTTFFYGFSGTVQEKKCVRRQMYNHAKYEQELMKSDHKFMSHANEVILPLIRSHYLTRYQEGDRLLVVASSIAFVQKLTDVLKQEMPNLKVVSYLGGDEMSTIKSADVIVSTTGKSGTGLDIKKLTCVVNTVSIRSESLIPQLFGRLRKYPGREVVYVDMWDTNLSSQTRHADDRKYLVKNLSLKYFEYQSLYDLGLQTGEILPMN